jgi:uncharacterized protein (DUF1499 family)
VLVAEQTHSDSANGASWWSRAILIGAVVAAVLLPLGAVGTRLGVWTFSTGFLLLAAASALAAIGVVTGIAGLIAASRRGLTADKPGVLIGTVVSALILAVMGMQFYTASSVPAIHNISTDVVDPPRFEAVVPLRGPDANSLDFDAGKIAPLQQQAYPWVRPLESQLPPDQALRRAVAVLEELGLEIVHVDEAGGRVEATATTFWFGFKDDVVVRVRPAAAGSVVDVRSVSRVGVSDLGANARRIGRILDGMTDG